MHQQLKYLEEANQILSESINVDSDRNWFAYTTRMHVRLDIAVSVIQHNQDKCFVFTNSGPLLRKLGNLASFWHISANNVTFRLVFFDWEEI
jgi:hypothetical protein